MRYLFTAAFVLVAATASATHLVWPTTQGWPSCNQGTEKTVYDPVTHGLICVPDATGGGGSDPWTYLQVNAGSDFTTTSASAVNATGLTLTPAANTSYEMECRLGIRTATATVNPRVGFAWSTGLTDGFAMIEESQAAGTVPIVANGNINAALLIAVGGLPNTTQSWPVRISAAFRAGASPSGDTRVQLASETAGTTVRIVTAGSFCRYRTHGF